MCAYLGMYLPYFNTVQMFCSARMPYDQILQNCFYYSPASEASREVANLTERKNLHTPIYVTSFSKVHTEETVSIGLKNVLRMVTSILHNQISMLRSRACQLPLSFFPNSSKVKIKIRSSLVHYTYTCTVLRSVLRKPHPGLRITVVREKDVVPRFLYPKISKVRTKRKRI